MKRLLLALTLFAIVTPALAVDLTQRVTNVDGKPIVDAANKDVGPVLSDVLKATLLVTDQAMTKDDKVKNFDLALKIGLNKNITFTPQELTHIEDMLWKYQSTLVAGQTVRLIDPTFAPVAK